MANMFSKAQRQAVWTKVLLGGPSGSGKTYSALLLASGLAKKAGSRIAFIDTENKRSLYYAKEFDFDSLILKQPYSQRAYTEAIQSAIDNGYQIIVIDSLTHEWQFTLEQHNNMPGNSYTNWAKVGPVHEKFMEYILQCPAHIISTARGDDKYVLEADQNGKMLPKKIGLGIEQRKDVEYNYTCTFMIDQKSHVADVTKDNTHLFEGRYQPLTSKDGEDLFKWANDGIESFDTIDYKNNGQCGASNLSLEQQFYTNDNINELQGTKIDTKLPLENIENDKDLNAKMWVEVSNRIGSENAASLAANINTIDNKKFVVLGVASLKKGIADYSAENAIARDWMINVILRLVKETELSKFSDATLEQACLMYDRFISEHHKYTGKVTHEVKDGELGVSPWEDK